MITKLAGDYVILWHDARKPSEPIRSTVYVDPTTLVDIFNILAIAHLASRDEAPFVRVEGIMRRSDGFAWDDWAIACLTAQAHGRDTGRALPELVGREPADIDSAYHVLRLSAYRQYTGAALDAYLQGLRGALGMRDGL